MKLKVKDLRPKHQFETGDIVQIHANQKIAGSLAIVVSTFTTTDNNLLCNVYCCPSAKINSDLYTGFRHLQRCKMTGETKVLLSVPANRLNFIVKAPKDWTKDLTAVDVKNIRFELLLDEE